MVMKKRCVRELVEGKGKRSLNEADDTFLLLTTTRVGMEYTERRKTTRLGMTRLVQYRYTTPTLAKAEGSTLTEDISSDGLRFLLAERLPNGTPLTLTLKLPVNETNVVVQGKVIWQDRDTLPSNTINHAPRFVTGLQFSELGEYDRSRIHNLIRNGLKQGEKEGVKATLRYLEVFLGVPLPNHVREHFKDPCLFVELNQQQIMEVIGLTPPFLKIQKLIIAGTDRQDLLQSRSLGMGVVSQTDTEGHYNRLISLALCGQLMASTAAIHLAALFPNTAPQALEVNGITPLGPSGKKLWKPSVQGTHFFAEASFIRKKMHVVYMTSKISFGNLEYGMIKELKFALLPEEILSSAIEIQCR